ncbi:MAG: hypothetical protein IIA30_17215 [Myxococcales bacterium]|nr:hypothetical protein [Myxococcales bacterium]
MNEASPIDPSPEAQAPESLRPSYEVISLACEITAYAPDDDERPLL